MIKSFPTIFLKLDHLRPVCYCRPKMQLSIEVFILLNHLDRHLNRQGLEGHGPNAGNQD